MDKLIRDYMAELGRKGVKKRFSGKTKEEISELMSQVGKANKKNRV